MRIEVFASDADSQVEEAFAGLPGVSVARRRWTPCRSSVPAAYVAFEPEHLERYERWFPGVTVRVASRLRTQPLQAGGAVYLPVTYNSWLVVVDGPDAFPAALEAARSLSGVQMVACPELPRPPSPAPAYRRCHDRVIPA